VYAMPVTFLRRVMTVAGGGIRQPQALPEKGPNVPVRVFRWATQPATGA
jgi:hypothetical protein